MLIYNLNYIIFFYREHRFQVIFFFDSSVRKRKAFFFEIFPWNKNVVHFFFIKLFSSFTWRIEIYCYSKLFLQTLNSKTSLTHYSTQHFFWFTCNHACETQFRSIPMSPFPLRNEIFLFRKSFFFLLLQNLEEIFFQQHFRIVQCACNAGSHSG